MVPFTRCPLSYRITELFSSTKVLQILPTWYGSCMEVCFDFNFRDTYIAISIVLLSAWLGQHIFDGGQKLQRIPIYSNQEKASGTYSGRPQAPVQIPPIDSCWLSVSNNIQLDAIINPWLVKKKTPPLYTPPPDHIQLDIHVTWLFKLWYFSYDIYE